jgi:hypothetical protein
MWRLALGQQNGDKLGLPAGADSCGPRGQQKLSARGCVSVESTVTGWESTEYEVEASRQFSWNLIINAYPGLSRPPGSEPERESDPQQTLRQC